MWQYHEDVNSTFSFNYIYIIFNNSNLEEMGSWIKESNIIKNYKNLFKYRLKLVNSQLFVVNNRVSKKVSEWSG